MLYKCYYGNKVRITENAPEKFRGLTGEVVDIIPNYRINSRGTIYLVRLNKDREWAPRMFYSNELEKIGNES